MDDTRPKSAATKVCAFFSRIYYQFQVHSEIQHVVTDLKDPLEAETHILWEEVEGYYENKPLKQFLFV